MSKYHLGQTVRVRENVSFAGRAGLYRIVQVLPKEGHGQRYRIKSEQEVFQRTIGESGLDEIE